MHELSIALSIIELAEIEAERRRVHVSAVHLKLGRLSGVVKDALLASYDLAAAGTPLEGSRLIVDEIPIRAWCARCNAAREIDAAEWFTCPQCRSPISQILAGKELEVSALEIAE